MRNAVLTIPVFVMAGGGTPNGAGGYSGSPATVSGSPFAARRYRMPELTVNRDYAQQGGVTIDRDQRLAFAAGAAISQENVAPVPVAGTKAVLSSPAASGSAATVAVNSTLLLSAGMWVFVGGESAAEAVKVIAIVDGTHFTANLVNAHNAGEIVGGAVFAKVLRVRSYTRSVQCDLEVGTVLITP